MNVWLENSEKLGVASLQIQEQFNNVQQEHNMLKGQVADLEQQLVLAESQLEEFRVRIEANNSLFLSLVPLPHYGTENTINVRWPFLA